MNLTEDQRKAVTRLDGNVFVAAGAGSGKTRVVTKRFVYAVATGYAKVDEILTITFTKKAAAEMMNRIRMDLHDRKTVIDSTPDMEARMAEAYRNIETAKISTIDSFCSSLLRSNAVAAGLDPDFEAIDESKSQILMEETFDHCLLRLASRGQQAVDFITAYDPNRQDVLFNIIKDTYATLRSQGKPATLPDVAPISIRASEQELRRLVHESLVPCKHITHPSEKQQEGLDKLTRLCDALAERDMDEKARLLDMKKIAFSQMGPAREAFRPLEDARKAYLADVLNKLAELSLGFFRDLLVDFNASYMKAKRAHGFLDFADLAFLTRELLKKKSEVRSAVSKGLRLVMVDEFQDTNPLQFDLINHLANDNLFVVGDENQAIYGFRDAEVGLFQQEKERAKAGGYLIELKENFRSQAEVLSFIDYIFDRPDMLQPGYLRLKASTRQEAPRDFRIDLNLLDTGGHTRSPDYVKTGITRPAEAELIARRVAQLIQDGYGQGDIAVLVRSRTDAQIYRDALTRHAIESYFAVGSSYYKKLELNNIYSILRLLINPHDDVAFLTALRSPFVRMSEDGLYWLCNTADSLDSLWLQAKANPANLSNKDAVLLRKFIDNIEGIRLRAARLSLSSLCREIIEMDDYITRVAASSDGRQQVANLFKLIELATDFEESWGSDLADFVEFLEHQKQAKAKEGDANIAAEGVDAVLMLTMHSAKGLEFPVVVLPNLQGNGKGGQKPCILLDRGRGRRIGLALRTKSGIEAKVFDYDELAKEEADRGKREAKRLGYVAMTRAKSHLVVSGVANIAAAPTDPDKKKTDPALDWLRRSLNLVFERDETVGDQSSINLKGCPPVGFQLCIRPAEVALQSSAETTARPDSSVGTKLSAAIDIMPDPAIYVPRSLSPTSLDTYAACPRRYYLENELRVGDLPLKHTGEGKPAVEGGMLSASDLGRLVHSLLETNLPATGIETITSDIVKERAGVMPGVKSLAEADVERAIELVANLGGAGMAEELFAAERSGRLKKELEFRTLCGATIIQGQIDALFTDGSGSVVVDYKTGAIGNNRPPEDAAASYRYQMASYALAAGRLEEGCVKIVLVFLGGPKPVEIVTDYIPAELAGLERELEELIGSMASATFPELDAFDEHTCFFCEGGVNGARMCRVAVPAKNR